MVLAFLKKLLREAAIQEFLHSFPSPKRMSLEIEGMTAVTTGMERFTSTGPGTEQLRNRRDTRYRYVGLIICTVK